MTRTTPGAMRDFSESLPMTLMKAREAVMGNFRPTLSEHGVTEQQFRVLRALTMSPTGIEFGDLAERTILLGPSLSRIVANLEERGLITRVPVERDARRANITISVAGTELVSAIAPDSEHRYAIIEQNMGSAQMEELVALLTRLTIAANTSPDDGLVSAESMPSVDQF